MHHGQQFLKFALDCGALQFGEFQLKSGRISPYFFNLAKLHTGDALLRLGRCYAEAVMDSGIAFDMLFGPAYKGIPIVSVTATALAQHFGVDAKIAFNRKEAKQHGEGGSIIGAPLGGKVLVLDDVTTAGTAARESFAHIRSAGAAVAGLVIAFDREEKAPDSGISIVEILRQEDGIQVASIATFTQLTDWLPTLPGYADHAAALSAYRDAYGARARSSAAAD